MIEVSSATLDYLKKKYPFVMCPEEAGGYTILFPDLPGCMTCVDRMEDVEYMTYDAKLTWFVSMLNDNMAINEPYTVQQYKVIP